MTNFNKLPTIGKFTETEDWGYQGMGAGQWEVIVKLGTEFLLE